MPSEQLACLSLKDIQPSQFYLSQEKLKGVESWFLPKDLSNFQPVPVKLLDGAVIFTDGHTRAFAAFRAGLEKIPMVWDEDELDWELYRACVSACKARGIFTIGDLEGRILPGEEYRRLWNGWCDCVVKGEENGTSD